MWSQKTPTSSAESQDWYGSSLKQLLVTHADSRSIRQKPSSFLQPLPALSLISQPVKLDVNKKLMVTTCLKPSTRQHFPNCAWIWKTKVFFPHLVWNCTVIRQIRQILSDSLCNNLSYWKKKKKKCTKHTLSHTKSLKTPLHLYWKWRHAVTIIL